MIRCYVAGKTIAGTTDSPTELSHNPSPKEAEIQFILSEIKHYLSADLEGKCHCILLLPCALKISSSSSYEIPLSVSCKIEFLRAWLNQ